MKACSSSGDAARSKGTPLELSALSRFYIGMPAPIWFN